MTVESRRAAAFVRAYWEDFPQALQVSGAQFDQGPAAFEQAVARAWNIRDAKRVVAAAEAAAARGGLSPDLCIKAMISLYPHDRVDQQLRLANDPAVAAIRLSKLMFHRSRALAAAGLWREARAVADEAFGARPALAAAAELVRALDEVGRTSGIAAGSKDWADHARHLDAVMALRAHGEARAIAERACRLPIPKKRNRMRDLCRVLDAGLSYGLEVSAVAAVLAAAREAHPEDASVRALQLDCDVMQGHAALAVARAESEPPPDDAYHDGAWDYALANARLEAGHTLAAATDLGALSLAHPRHLEMRASLAFAVGEAVLQGVPRRPRAPRPRKIISVFPFNDELALLKIRLHEMAQWVDHFILVEAAQTFVGNPKPLAYAEHIEHFAAFQSQIVHVTVDSFPDHVSTHWARDFYQRDAAAVALSELCSDRDLVLITDVDEIVDRRALEGFEGDFARLHMPLHRFFLNYRPLPGNRARNGRAGAVWRADTLGRYGLSYARFHLSRLEKDWARILDAGWHFSSLGDAERIARKYANYAHQESGKGLEALRERSSVEVLLNELQRGHVQEGWERCEIDDAFPAYIREHRDELSSLIL